jgi:tetratricopeptide (TPR) repeat protein
MLQRSWIIVLVAGLVVCGGTLSNSFHYDDFHSIVDNINLRVSRVGTEVVKGYFTNPGTFSVDGDKAMYRPLLVTSFALNHAMGIWLGLGGYHDAGYHVVNVALHLGCAVLVLWLAALLGASRRAGLLAGLIFVLHPVASEPVNYISSRSESLSVLFYLLAVCLFLRGESGNSRWRWGAWLAMAAGLLSKSTTITLPAAVLLLDVLIISGRDMHRVARRFVSHHLPGWIVALLYLAIVIGNGWLGRSLAQQVRGPWEQALTQLKASVYYLVLLVTPVHQSVEPQFAEQAAFATETAGPLLLLLTLSGGAWWLARSGRWRALFLLSWTVLHLMPTAVVPLNVLVNERRAYGPLAILCIGAGILLASTGFRRQRRVLAVAGCIILGALSVERSRVWADEFTLWRDAVRKAPRMPRGHLYLGNAHKDAAQHEADHVLRDRHWQAADEAYGRAHEEARELDLQLRALNNRGGVRLAKGLIIFHEDRARASTEFSAAEKHFQTAVQRNPSYADAIVNLGNVTIMSARVATTRGEADSLLRRSIEYNFKALALRPNHSQAHSNLGVSYQDLGEYAEAVRYYRRALRLTPRDWLTMKNLASVLYQQAEQEIGRGVTDAARATLVEARTFAQQALRLNPAVPSGQQVLQAIESRLQTLPRED